MYLITFIQFFSLQLDEKPAKHHGNRCFFSSKQRKVHKRAQPRHGLSWRPSTFKLGRFSLWPQNVQPRLERYVDGRYCILHHLGNIYTVTDQQIEYEFNYFRYLNFGPDINHRKPHMQLEYAYSICWSCCNLGIFALKIQNPIHLLETVFTARGLGSEWKSSWAM